MAASNLLSMQQYWKNFNLQELQRELDTTATELAAKQDESDAARKKLVEQSRDFKKNTPEELRKVVAPLLKGFQGEIDSLSKRSKNAEASFLSIYKRLIDVPDPCPTLDHALTLQKKAQRAKDLETENKQLRETLDEYNNEFAEIKNQEVTIKQLKDKLKDFEDKMEHTVQVKTKEKEKELQRQFSEQERQLQETQMEVAKKLGEAEHKVSTLQAALDSAQSELFDIKAKYDECTSAKSDEMEMLMADLERANERAASAERQSEQWKGHLDSATQNLQQAERMQKAPDMEQAIDILKHSSLEVELAAKEKEISQLVEDVQRLQGIVNKMRDAESSQIAKMEEELSAKNRAFRIMEEKLRSQEDYEEVKRELSVLKSIEFSKDEEAPADPKAKTLETLLLEKNRHLQTENTQLKVSQSSATGSPSAVTPSSSSRKSSPSCSMPSSLVSPMPKPPAPLAPTDNFASMIGQELVASFHLQNHLHFAAVAAMQNGHHPMPPHHPLANGFVAGHIPQMPLPMPMPSSPTEGRFPPSPVTHSPPNDHMQRIQNIARSESNNVQSLDTADVAQKIREILSSNNIGQRLFAKHVLGLSQGTVSELLSKPKHWDKLTEKGRESYRKMFAWAADEANVLALKAISPKKGSQPMMSSFRQEDSATEERIAQILSDAQVAMQSKNSQEKSQVANAMVASIYQTELAKMNGGNSPAKGKFKVEGDTGRGRKAQIDSDNMSQDMVARIYQEQLSKLAEAAEQSGNMAESTLYRQELIRINNETQMRNGSTPRPHMNDIENKENVGCQDIVMQDGSLDLSIKVKQEPRGEEELSTPSSAQADLSPNSTSSESIRHAGSAFFLVRPKSNSATASAAPASASEGAPAPPAEGMSPLQRMQSIANSLMSKNQVAGTPPRTLRAVLPPITQEEFDRYGVIDTEDLVRQVKDMLSQFSISQRLFGENVLGLSQGSVSDLLARPKPWHMLTQKGREPFIRMKLFLEQQESIPNLVASQYHISVDKFLRTNQAYSNTALPGPPPSSGRQPKQSMPSSTSSSSSEPPKKVRKRKGSQDDLNSSDGSSKGFSNKKPRVFFSEDQKDLLRQAYHQDPYPNQASIEQLASQLGVGTKTVVNWFHNHRMRAKQHNSNASSPARASPICRNPLTPSSDMCDSSMDASRGRGMVDENSKEAANDEKENNASQWIFPTYEPLVVEPIPEMMEDKSVSPPAEDNNNKEDLNIADMLQQQQQQQCAASSASSGGNRRKSARPQWLYEGTQLEKDRLEGNGSFSQGNSEGEDSKNSEKEEEMEEEEDEEVWRDAASTAQPVGNGMGEEGSSW